MKYLGVKGHKTVSVILNGSALLAVIIYLCIYREIKLMRRMLIGDSTVGHLVKQMNIRVNCILTIFFYV